MDVSKIKNNTASNVAFQIICCFTFYRPKSCFQTYIIHIYFYLQYSNICTKFIEKLKIFIDSNFDVTLHSLKINVTDKKEYLSRSTQAYPRICLVGGKSNGSGGGAMTLIFEMQFLGLKGLA